MILFPTDSKLCTFTISHLASDVNKDLTFKAKDKDFSSKDKDKDCIVKDKDQDKDCILVLIRSP